MICPSSACRHLLHASGAKGTRGSPLSHPTTNDGPEACPFSPLAGRRSRQRDEGPPKCGIPN
ncbi:hypothetical protein CN212_18375 [Sinorhizobium meliloti]|nr:hypothetical protein CN220_22810 [Sinorhizobium meliloti]RVH47886.1 hypothetical protein CN212_18375 [Sinorhizobium meliloti]RVO70126.1 hypothetical protein CN087_07270 [Sinorhizobium meliloti]